MKRIFSALAAVILFCGIIGRAAANDMAVYSLNAAEVNALARFVSAESEGQGMVCALGVAAAMLNRLDDPRYPNTVSGLLSGVSLSPRAPDGRAIFAVRSAAMGMDPTDGATEWARRGHGYGLRITLEADEMVFGIAD